MGKLTFELEEKKWPYLEEEEAEHSDWAKYEMCWYLKLLLVQRFLKICVKV